MAAMIRMIATVISNSISENPFVLFILISGFRPNQRGRASGITRLHVRVQLVWCWGIAEVTHQ